jgi:hypothetical protein
MWEEEPVGVDPKRPLVGFALVAVLCAVLMTLSVGRGWGVDLFHPGKPIATSAAGGHVDRVPSPSPQRVPAAEAKIPAELSTQPLGVAVGAPTAKQASQPTGDTGSESVRETPSPDATRASKDVRAADKAAAKALRQADKAAAKALRQADKAALKALRQADKAAAKALRQADKAAAKALRQADKAAEKAAEQAAAEAARLLDKLVRIDAKAAEKALRQG